MDIEICKKRIFIIGYFEHNNIGDEQYKDTFTYFLNKYLPNNVLINYINCDKLLLYDFDETDIIILGGGDILNDYFLDTVIKKFNNKKNKILAVSVGLPYINIIKHTNKLNIIDNIFIRSKQDIQEISQYYQLDKILYIPDMSRYILDLKQSSKIKVLQKIKTITKKIICISLNQHIKGDNDEYYTNCINNLHLFIKYLIISGFFIIFVPYNTNSKNPQENDILIHNDIYNKLRDDTLKLIQENMINIDYTLNGNDILEIYSYSYVNIVMRFHACLFSIYSNTPMLPIFTTKKIKNLLLDIDWNNGYELQVDTNDIPINIDLNILNTKFKNLTGNMNKLLIIKLHNINNINNNSNENITKLVNIINNPCLIKKKVDESDNPVNKKINNLFNKIQEITKGVDFRLITDVSLQNTIISITSFYLTGKVDSKYNYGLSTKMFKENFNYKQDFKWIILDYIHPKPLYNNPNGLFNLNYIDQKDYSGAHRSGWQYVYDNIKLLHNNESDLYLDLYLDKTFHWNKNINKVLGIIPYKKNWCGFIHHTFDETFSEYNCINLLKNQDFIESLKYCKGIFVLSKYLADILSTELCKININIKINILTHPTETPLKTFNIQKFIENKNKKIINVGGWLRNIFSFYNLSLPKIYKFSSKCFKKQTCDTICKVALKGYNMNNYYPTKDLLKCKDLSKCICKDISQNIFQCNISQNVSCTNNNKNNWIKDYINFTKDMISSVDIIEQLSNDDYDILLSENIVFINLVDASAVNTIIECKIRNTPIIVNKHPAIVEMLGETYPLYYDNNLSYYEINKQVENLLSNTCNINKAFEYLEKLNKKDLLISTFVKSLKDNLVN
jgi:polysaccharide pyruvyl transferase WcaK-like protein